MYVNTTVGYNTNPNQRRRRNGVNNGNNYGPTFPDRNKRRSVNKLPQTYSDAERRRIESMGLEISATGQVMNSMGERRERGLIYGLGRILTGMVVYPVRGIKVIKNFISESLSKDYYDSDEPYERDFPDEIYEVKQNTRTTYYGDPHSLDAEPNYNRQPNAAMVSMVQYTGDAVTDALNLARNKINDLRGKQEEEFSSSSTVFGNNDLDLNSNKGYEIGDKIILGSAYEILLDQSLLLDMKLAISIPKTMLELKNEVGNIKPARKSKSASSFFFALNPATQEYVLFRGGAITNLFRKVSLSMDLYKSGELIPTGEIELIELSTSKVFIQVPEGYQLKLRFIVR